MEITDAMKNAVESVLTRTPTAPAATPEEVEARAAAVGEQVLTKTKGNLNAANLAQSEIRAAGIDAVIQHRAAGPDGTETVPVTNTLEVLSQGEIEAQVEALVAEEVRRREEGTWVKPDDELEDW